MPSPMVTAPWPRSCFAMRHAMRVCRKRLILVEPIAKVALGASYQVCPMCEA